MILKKADIRHMVRAVASATRCNDLVLVGSSALISYGSNLSASLMLTDETDIYVRDAADPADMQDFIEGTFGIGTHFHKTFKYHVDAVSPSTSVMPDDWETRAHVSVIVEGEAATLTCPEPDDLALAKLVAWREKDVAWLNECAAAGIISPERMRTYAVGLSTLRLAAYGLVLDDVVARIGLIAPSQEPAHPPRETPRRKRLTSSPSRRP